MEALIARQAEILEEIKRIHSNFKKDSVSRKTTEYLKARLERLDELWVEAQRNDAELSKIEDPNHQYFSENIIDVLASWFKGARSAITSYSPVVETNSDNPNNGGSRTRFDSSTFGKREMKAIELQQTQYANFRAFKKLTNNIRSDTISEKWEIEDKLRSLETRWGAIDRLHLQIDGILEGADGKYYEEFGTSEMEFERLKRALNVKLNASAHQQQSMPKIEIPTFSGNYNQWPTFMDLYSEAIHKNPSLSKAQKMQHLKGKLRGEAERIVQHLHVSMENYDTCWDLLTHRYNNRQLLFTKHIQVLMRQPTVQKQSAFELKRMYDNSMEAIHAIHNLGIDTTSWDPILVHILCEKLDTDTYSDYMESRSEPRELPVFDDFMTFIENKFTALEPLHKKKFENTERREQKPQFNNSHFPHSKGPRQNYQQQTYKPVPYFRNKFNAYYNVGYKKTICPICNSDHALFYCATFRDMSAEAKLTALTKTKVCKNCLYQHNSEHCKSEKRCRECNASHHTLLHDLFKNKEGLVPPTPKSPFIPPKSSPHKEAQNNFVSNDEEEVLLATALVKVRAIDGEYITLRALIDQGSQVTLITENAAQRLGVRREQLHASISGVGTLSNKSRGKVELHCNSIYDDFHFNTEALVMTRVVNNLPNTSFEKKAWEHVSNITLADPDYNVSRSIDMLLDAQVYSEILMSGLIKGQGLQPIAQQTRLGWILSGSVKTYNCHVLTHNIKELAKYWEVEDINEQSQSAMTSQEQYCEDNYSKTTRRLESGRYVVSLPMKENYETLLGTSKMQAIAQFRQLERKFEKNEQLSTSYKQFMREYLEMAHMKEAKVHKDPSCYLPHHGVIKQDSLTTKLRTVFNASMKTSSGYSLNDLMECGPKLHQDLQALLIGWRLYKYVFTADCEKMYRMILVREEDQKLQKIVWRDTPESPITEYQLCTVTYGTKAAPYLALRTLKQLAQDDAQLYPLAADVINNQMYVDDVISGSNSLPQAQQIQQQLIHMFQGAGLNLRKWASNETSLLNHITNDNTAQNTLHIRNEGAMKALGLQWNPETDDFAFKNKMSTECEAKQKHKQTCVTQRDSSTIILDLINKHSSMSHITHTVTWIYRFINNARSQTAGSQPQRQEYLTNDELTNALKVIVKQVQSYEFKDEISKLRAKQQISLKSGILSLNPFIDSENVLRVGGRLTNSTLHQNAKCPMLIPHNSILTELIITQAHQQTLHGGPKLTLTHLRQRFWVVGGYRAVKRVVHKCITCRRHSARNPTQIMADLPAPRVTVSRPFSHSGVDFSGNVQIKANKGRGIKTLTAYIAVFICLATKAIHLELVTDLSSTAFLAAFKRFCARRGKPQDMYSDNGTNFVGANRLLRQQYRNILSTIDTQFLSKISEMGINWHFNAPAWPSAGGLWESAVKSMKFHLKRVLGDQKLTYEEFSTLLCEIEACLNSRPLCSLTENKEDINCLTPGHFLVGTPIMALSETEQGTLDLRKRWQLVQKLSKDFWKIWSKEYLQQLQARLKWKKVTRDTQIGDLVCIKDEHLPAGRWALGRVLQLHPGQDGHTRVITLKTARGETKRPILKTVPLLDANKDDMESVSSEQSRRKTRKSSLKTLLCYSWLFFMTLVTPAVQQQAQFYETTTLSNNQSLYFDKLGKVQEVKDEWKLVIYYNMTSYWANVNMLDQYVDHLKKLGKEDWIMQFQLLLNQVQQNLHELDYYNQLLAPTHEAQEKRFRRGLVNGIGTLANELFGVLDERFAERYGKDITTIQHNEKHLLHLIKNQTSILEAENNIIQRNEATMTKQVDLISQHLNTLNLDIMKQRIASENALYLMSSTLAADSLIQHLKNIQQTLINTLTNMYQGHIDVHLLSPDQLQNELNKIARHLAHNLALPDTQDDIRDLYRLLRVHARVTQQYIIMEVKIPLLNDESYELDKLISVPKHLDPDRIMSTIPTTELIAFNIQKDTFIPLNPNDLHECQKMSEDTYMCILNHPEYNLKPYRSICDVNLVKYNEVHNTYCHIETATCADKWIKLHERNSWLYFCCDKCDVRIICPAGMTSVSLRQTGVITLSRGCVLKGDTFMLYTNNEHVDHLTISTPSITFPNRSPLNHIISTAIISNLTTPTHAQQFAKIREDIQMMKKQSEIEPLTIHDLHHYIMIYIVVCLGVIAIIATVGWRIRTKNKQEKEYGSRPPRAEGRNVREERGDALCSAVKSDTKCSVVSETMTVKGVGPKPIFNTEKYVQTSEH